MPKVFDEKLKEFINNEIESINLDKERIAEEKNRIRLEICKLFNIDCLKRSDEQKEQLEFMQKYYNVLIEQYGLLGKRDIAIFSLIANISDNRMNLDAPFEKQIRDKKKNGSAMVEDTQEQKYKDSLIGISDYLQNEDCHCLITRDIQGNLEHKVQCTKCDILEFVDDVI